MRMNVALITVALLMLAFVCPAFEPTSSHFTKSSGFEAYQSWLRNGEMYNDTPASLDATSIKMTYYSGDGAPVRVGFVIERGLLAENTEIWTEYGESHPNDPVMKALGAFLFNLNCDNPEFFLHYVYMKEVQIEQDDRYISADTLYARLNGRRMIPQVISFEHSGGTRIRIEGTVDFTIMFDIKANWRDAEAVIPQLDGREPVQRRQPRTVVVKPDRVRAPATVTEEQEPEDAITEPEPPKETPGKKWEPKPSREVATMVQASDLPNIRTTSLEEMLEAYSDRILTRKVLQNQVKDPAQFIREEFPDYRIDIENNRYRINHDRYDNMLYSEIDVYSTILSDGVQISSMSDYAIEGRNIVLPSGERITTGNLSDEEIEMIAPNLVALCNQHRSLGKRLIHFLLTPDAASTTLVLKGNERKLYEMHSYLQLLLLLNHWWQDRTVFFSITEVKKVNDYIEFRGNLVARKNDDHGRFDFAEVRFHLNQYYRIDLAMMFLTPDSVMVSGESILQE